MEALGIIVAFGCAIWLAVKTSNWVVPAIVRVNGSVDAGPGYTAGAIAGVMGSIVVGAIVGLFAYKVSSSIAR